MAGSAVEHERAEHAITDEQADIVFGASKSFVLAKRGPPEGSQEMKSRHSSFDHTNLYYRAEGLRARRRIRNREAPVAEPHLACDP